LSQTDVISVGALPYSDQEKWIEAIKESPSPVEMTLSPISELLRAPFLNHIPLDQDKPDGEKLDAGLLKSFYDVTLDTYCEIVLGSPCPVQRSCTIWNDCNPDQTCVDDNSEAGFHCENRECNFVVDRVIKKFDGFSKPKEEVTVHIEDWVHKCKLRVFGVGGGGEGSAGTDHSKHKGGGGGSGYIIYEELEVSGPSEIKLTVGAAGQPSIVKVNGKRIMAAAGQNGGEYGKGGDGFSGGGGYDQNDSPQAICESKRSDVNDGPYPSLDTITSGWSDRSSVSKNRFISAIRGRGAAAIDMLQVKYGDVWASAHGGSGGTYVSCTFDSVILKVKLTYSSNSLSGVFFVNGLEFFDANGNTCKIGDWKNDGKPGSSGGYAHNEGYYLSYISGGIGNWDNRFAVVNPITFHWTPIQDLREFAGSNGENGPNHYYNTGGEGTGEDIATFKLENFNITAGRGGCGTGGGGGVLVDGNGPDQGIFGRTGQGYGGGGGGGSGYDVGNQGVILLEMRN